MSFKQKWIGSSGVMSMVPSLRICLKVWYITQAHPETSMGWEYLHIFSHTCLLVHVTISSPTVSKSSVHSEHLANKQVPTPTFTKSRAARISGPKDWDLWLQSLRLSLGIQFMIFWVVDFLKLCIFYMRKWPNSAALPEANVSHKNGWLED